MKRRMIAATTLAAVLILGGCAGLTLRPPSVTLAGMEVIEAGLFEQRFAFKLRVMNPNPVELPINGLSFEVELNGEPFAKGVSNKPVTVPSLGEALLDVTAVSEFSGVLRQISAISRGRTDTIAYRINGRLVIGSMDGLNFDESGKLNLPKPWQNR